jgi:hypothetical protein
MRTSPSFGSLSLCRETVNPCGKWQEPFLELPARLGVTGPSGEEVLEGLVSVHQRLLEALARRLLDEGELGLEGKQVIVARVIADVAALAAEGMALLECQVVDEAAQTDDLSEQGPAARRSGRS